MADTNALYFSQDSTLTIPMKDFMDGFRDFGRVRGYCRSCRRYGKCWACPPYGFDEKELLEQYSEIKLIATKITPSEGVCLTPEMSEKLIREERIRLDRQLIAAEKQHNGQQGQNARAFFAGTCLLCPLEECTRSKDAPCRHPEAVRPSLEAMGFDVVRTCSELLGIPMQWGKDGKSPEYLVLVSALAF